MASEFDALNPNIGRRELRKYFQMCGQIDRALHGDGRNPDERERDINYFGGIGRVLSDYRLTSGRDRYLYIKALGGVLVSPGIEPFAKAGLVGLVSALDLSELQPRIDELRIMPEAFEQVLSRAIDTYDTMRRISALGA